MTLFIFIYLSIIRLRSLDCILLTAVYYACVGVVLGEIKVQKYTYYTFISF